MRCRGLLFGFPTLTVKHWHYFTEMPCLQWQASPCQEVSYCWHVVLLMITGRDIAALLLLAWGSSRGYCGIAALRLPCN